MHRTAAILLIALGCNGGPSTGDATSTGEPVTTVTPSEGLWRLTIGEVQGGDCDGSQVLSVLEGGALYLSDDGDGFALAYREGEPPIHTCVRDGDGFTCPFTMIVGTSCDFEERTLVGAFESSTRASGVATGRFTCIMEDLGPDVPCCGSFGAVSPCTRDFAFTLAWESA